MKLCRRNLNQQNLQLPLKNIHNTHYDTELFFGTHKDPFNLIIDTGSTELWIPDVSCDQCKAHKLWKQYDCQKSSTCKIVKIDQNNKEKQLEKDIVYAIGNIQGYAVKDRIYLSQDDQTGFFYQFLLVQNVHNLNIIQGQGIIGLGRQNASEFNTTLLYTMKQQGIIDNMIFSLYLNDANCQGNSALTIGGYNKTYAQEEVQYISLNTKDLWSVDLTGITIQYEAQVEKLKLKSHSAVFDSGTTKIILPLDDLNSITTVLTDNYGLNCRLERLAENQDIVSIVCDNSDEFPTFYISLGKDEEVQKIEFKPSDYIERCLLRFTKLKCVLYFQSINESEDDEYTIGDVILLGDAFMKKYLTVFDTENSRIGIALANTELVFENFHRNRLIMAYGGIAVVIVVLLLLLTICLIHNKILYEQYLKQNQVEGKTNETTNNQTDTDQQIGGGTLEITSPNKGEQNESMESEECSEEISDIDSSANKQQQSIRNFDK